MGQSTHDEPAKQGGYVAGDEIASKYRLVRPLGEGGMGAVWLARNLVLDVDVAIKLIHRDLAVPDASNLLLKEARTAAQLGHRSIVRVFDFGTTERGDPYIVMEVLVGISLASMLERSSRIEPADIVRTLLPIANALAAAHDRGVVHCDVKPDNILLVNEASAVVPKLVDFGIAKFGRHGANEGGVETILGTPDYMSPEQVEGRERLDGRTDVWSLSVVIYEALSGRKPFTGTTVAAQFSSVLGEVPATATHESPELAAIVERGLAKDRGERWPSMRAFAQALSAWALENGIETDITGTSLSGELGRPSSPRTSGSFLAPEIRPGRPAAPAPSAATARTERAGSAPAAPKSATRAPILVVAQAPVARTKDAGVASDGRAEPESQPQPPPRRRRGRIVLAVSLVLLAAVGAFAATPAGRIRLAGARAWLSPTPRPEPAAPTSPTEDRPAPAGTAAPPASVQPATRAASSEPTQTAAPAAPESVGACVLRLLPATFDAREPPALGPLCSEADPRRGAAAIRAEVVKAGGRRPATQGMREWAMLGWYELAATEIIRGRCCADAAPVTLPAPQGSCGSLAVALDDLRAAVRAGGDTDSPLARFRLAASCQLTSGVTGIYAYDRLRGGEEDTLRMILDRATGKEKAASPAPALRRRPATPRDVTPPASATADEVPEQPVEDLYQ